jgi:hypothetical protein
VTEDLNFGVTEHSKFKAQGTFSLTENPVTEDSKFGVTENSKFKAQGTVSLTTMFLEFDARPRRHRKFLDERENGEELQRGSKVKRPLDNSCLDDELRHEDSERDDGSLQKLEGQRNEGYEMKEDDGQDSEGRTRKYDNDDKRDKPYSLANIFGGLQLECIEVRAKTAEINKEDMEGTKSVDFEGID